VGSPELLIVFSKKKVSKGWLCFIAFAALSARRQNISRRIIIFPKKTILIIFFICFHRGRQAAPKGKSLTANGTYESQNLLKTSNYFYKKNRPTAWNATGRFFPF
jgi:hypothetical protein